MVFQDEIDSLATDVATLTAAGVTKIIALNHVGILKDTKIARVVTGIDAVVGGHSHTLLSTSDPARLGPYPMWIDGAIGRPVPMVQAYAYGKYLGHLILTFDDAGALISATGDTILLDASVIPDPAVVARMAELSAPIEARQDPCCRNGACGHRRRPGQLPGEGMCDWQSGGRGDSGPGGGAGGDPCPSKRRRPARLD